MENQREITPQDTLYWETVEHNHSKKTADWYWVISIIALAIVVSAVILGNFTFALVITMLTIVLFMQSHRDPEIFKVGMSNKGIYVNKTFYPYEHLTSYWVETDIGVPRVIIKSSKLIMPLIIIPLDDVHPDDIEFFLGYYLDQEKLEESLLQILVEYVIG